MKITDQRWEDVEVLGVSVFGGPPLGTFHFKLSPGLHVFYGKNGAGKTRLLDDQGDEPVAVGGELRLFAPWQLVDDSLAASRFIYRLG